MQKMDAIILAAGLGTRLKPLTDNTPKPLVNVAGRAMVEYSIDACLDVGIKDILINASYKKEMIRQYFAEHKRANVSISFEDAPLETGGGIYKILHLLEDKFFVINSDIICLGNPLKNLAQAWQENLLSAMLMVNKHEVNLSDQKGDFVIENGKLRWPKEGETADYIFSGIHKLSKKLFTGITEQKFSLKKLWMQQTDESGFLQNIKPVIHDGMWLQAGDIEGLKNTEDYLLKQIA